MQCTIERKTAGITKKSRKFRAFLTMEPVDDQAVNVFLVNKNNMADFNSWTITRIRRSREFELAKNRVFVDLEEQ